MAKPRMLSLLQSGKLPSFGLTRERLVVPAEPNSWQPVEDFSATILVPSTVAGALIGALPLIREDDLLALLNGKGGPTSRAIIDTPVTIARPRTRSEYADELILRAYGSSRPRKGEGKPGVVVQRVLSQIQPDEKRQAPSRQTILRRLGWH